MKVLNPLANVLGLALACAAVVAPFTRPDQAAHERHVAAQLSAYQSQTLQEGSWLKWVIATGVDLARTGRYEEGLFSSSFQVLIGNHEVARCTGALGVVWCSAPRQS